MTKQETFDIVVNHLLTQNVQSKVVGCMYRGPNGTKCAVGVLIPDDKYSPRLEGQSVGNSEHIRLLLKELGHDIELCRALMGVHDCFRPNEWPRELSTVAASHGLNYNRRGYVVQGVDK